MKWIKIIFVALSLVSLSAYSKDNNQININIPLEERILSTGHKVWLSNNPDTELVTVYLIFEKTGSYFDPKGKEGLSEIYAKMFEEGIKGYNNEQIAKFKEKYGIELNITNYPENIQVSLTMPEEHTEKAMLFLNTYLNYPSFLNERLAKVQDKLAHYYKNALNDVSFYAKTKALPSFFNNTPLANVPNVNTIYNINTKDLHRFHRESFTSENLIIAAAGKINNSIINQYLPQIINNLSKNFVLKKIDEIAINSNKKSVFENNSQFQIGVIQFYSKNLPITYDDKIKFQLLNEIFGGSRFNTRLMNSLRVKNGLVYGAYSRQKYDSFHHFLSADIKINLDKFEEALKIVQNEIRKVNINGIEEKELIFAKNNLITSIAFMFETDRDAAAVLARLQEDFDDITAVTKLFSKINSVTKSDIDEASKNWFRLENFHFYLICDENKILDKSLIR